MSAGTFYVIEAGPGPGHGPGEPGDVATIPGGGADLHSLRTLRRWFAPAAREVPAERLLESFDKTRAAIDAMLARLEAQPQSGFRLDAFEVSLAVSGEGTIGIVTASAEAGVVLKFKRASGGGSA